MINKPLWEIWKGVPENLKEFKEVFILWICSAFLLGILIAMIIINILLLFGLLK